MKGWRGVVRDRGRSRVGAGKEGKGGEGALTACDAWAVIVHPPLYSRSATCRPASSSSSML